MAVAGLGAHHIQAATATRPAPGTGASERHLVNMAMSALRRGLSAIT